MTRASLSAHAAEHHPLRAITFFLGGVFLFACMDTITKYLTGHYAPPVVVAVRYLVHCLLMLVVLTPSQGRKLFQTQRTWLVLARAACLATGSLVFALALKRMPVAEATAVLFLAPIIIVLISGLMLGERAGALGWAAALAGFGGVLLIARPGGGLDLAGVLFALCGAVLTAVYLVLSRVLATTERTMAMLFYTALVGAIAFGLALPWFWGGDRPTTLQFVLFSSTGLLAGLGHYLITAAHRHAPASQLAPLQYVQLLWAGFLGWLVFGHVPDALAIVGMGVVAAAGAMTAVRSRLAARALEQASEA